MAARKSPRQHLHAAACVEFAMATPFERIEHARRGVAVELIPELAHDLRLPQDHLVHYLRLPRATVRRKLVTGERLAPEESEGVLALCTWLGQTVAPLADPLMAFNAAQWLGRWIRTPQPALDGYAPMQLLDTSEGRALALERLSEARASYLSKGAGSRSAIRRAALRQDR